MNIDVLSPGIHGFACKIGHIQLSSKPNLRTLGIDSRAYSLQENNLL